MKTLAHQVFSVSCSKDNSITGDVIGIQDVNPLCEPAYRAIMRAQRGDLRRC
ncbi:MAG: hypothetical protein ABIH34_01300 [Nanoarchaeota archaeon]